MYFRKTNACHPLLLYEKQSQRSREEVISEPLLVPTGHGGSHLMIRILQRYTQVGTSDPHSTPSLCGKPRSSSGPVTEPQPEGSLHHLLGCSHPHTQKAAQAVKEADVSTTAAWPETPFLFPVPPSPLEPGRGWGRNAATRSLSGPQLSSWSVPSTFSGRR